MAKSLKFKLWDKIVKRMSEWPVSVDLFINDPQAELLLYTGFKDKNEKEIYQGDIVSFHYDGSDVLSQIQDEEQADYFRKKINKTYTGVVSKVDDGSNNLEVVCAATKDTMHMIFSLPYLEGSTLLGNIYENPELI